MRRSINISEIIRTDGYKTGTNKLALDNALPNDVLYSATIMHQDYFDEKWAVDIMRNVGALLTDGLRTRFQPRVVHITDPDELLAAGFAGSSLSYGVCLIFVDKD